MPGALLHRGNAIQSGAVPFDSAGQAGLQGLGERRPRRLVGGGREVDEPERADELWRTTCFEAFLRPLGEEAYQEWNFAPSGKWASYQFSAYRENMEPAEVGSDPYIRLEDNFTWWALGATIAIPADTNWELGLSAVLEEKDGTKSYWALAHPTEKPDFHAPGCFAAHLP